MQITKIANNMNFGLTRSKEYIKAERSLINNLQNKEEKKEAKNIAKQIKNEVPNGYLTVATSTDGDIFMLRTTNGNAVTYRQVGTVDMNNPIDTLETLHESLQKFNPKN